MLAILARRGCRLDDAVALGIERDRGHRRPVSGLAAPAPWIGMACLLVKLVSGREQGAILAGVTLRRCHICDAAVPVFIVVPMDEAFRPLPCRIEFSEAFDRELRSAVGQEFPIGG